MIFEVTELLKSSVQEFNTENHAVHASTPKKQVLCKTDEFFLFNNKTLD